MSSDRTSEFLSVARGLKESGVAVQTPVSAPSSGRYGSNTASTPNEDLRNFHKMAAALSKDIAATSTMLGELTRLVQSKSLFVDNSGPINNLVVQIKSNVESLNGRLEQADAFMKKQKRLLNNNQSSQEAVNVVGQLQEEFGQTAAGFKKILQQRTDSIKDESQQKQMVYGAVGQSRVANKESGISLENKPPVYGDSSMLTPAAMNPTAFPTLDLTSGYADMMSPGESTYSGNSLPRPHGARADAGASTFTPTTRSDSLPTYSGGASSYYGNPGTGSSSAPLTPLDIARMEQESGQEQMMQLIPDQDYLRERADAMEAVESNIVELGKVFNRLATMVTEHREMVRRVEDNVDDANTNITLSMETLTDTLTSLRTNKALFLKVFSVLVVFIILFITFFA